MVMQRKLLKAVVVHFGQDHGRLRWMFSLGWQKKKTTTTHIDWTLVWIFFGRSAVGVFCWDDCCVFLGSYPNTQVLSQVVILEMKFGSFRAVPWAWFRQQCGILSVLCSSALAQILLQCDACSAHLIHCSGTLHTTVRQCWKCCESFVFRLQGEPVTLFPHFLSLFQSNVVQNAFHRGLTVVLFFKCLNSL
jgi:hypothetical protein